MSDYNGERWTLGRPAFSSTTILSGPELNPGEQVDVVFAGDPFDAIDRLARLLAAEDGDTEADYNANTGDCRHYHRERAQRYLDTLNGATP